MWCNIITRKHVRDAFTLLLLMQFLVCLWPAPWAPGALPVCIETTNKMHGMEFCEPGFWHWHLSEQFLWQFCGELRRFAETVIFHFKMANKYCGDLQRRRIRANPEQVSTFSLVKYHWEAGSEAQTSLRRSRYSSAHPALRTASRQAEMARRIDCSADAFRSLSPMYIYIYIYIYTCSPDLTRGDVTHHCSETSDSACPELFLSREQNKLQKLLSLGPQGYMIVNNYSKSKQHLRQDTSEEISEAFFC